LFSLARTPPPLAANEVKEHEMNNKVIAIVAGAIVAVFGVSLLLRIVVMNQYGISSTWMYFGLPFGGIGVLLLLLRLGLLSSGGRSGAAIVPFQHGLGAQTPACVPLSPAASVSQRLNELGALRANGAISEPEYSTMRQQIIAGL
jgi:hypothetical protein